MIKTPSIFGILVFFLIPTVSSVYAQEVIPVNVTSPCFLNDTAGVDMFQNCGMGTDYLVAALLPWNWITGGWFSMIVVSIIIMISYIKYHKAIYPVAIGVAFLPIAFYLYPSEIMTFAIVFAGLAMICLIYYIYMRQTKEYSG